MLQLNLLTSVVSVIIQLIIVYLYLCPAQAQDLAIGEENPIEMLSNLIPVIHDPYEEQYQQQQQQQQQSSNSLSVTNPGGGGGVNDDEFPDDYNAGTAIISDPSRTPSSPNGGRSSGTSTNTARARRRPFGGGDLAFTMPRSDNRNNRFMDDFLPSTRSGKCDRRIRVINGATRIRDRGALVRFQCSYGYHMLGASVAVCVRGQWSDPPPTCVREGCKKLQIPFEGSARQMFGGGVAIFTCNYGYELQGQRILTCDGQKWNGSEPMCTEIPPITIAPPSTTFPSLPEFILVTTGTTIANDSSVDIGGDSTTQPSRSQIDGGVDLDNGNAPPYIGKPDVVVGSDLVLLHSSSSPIADADSGIPTTLSSVDIGGHDHDVTADVVSTNTVEMTPLPQQVTTDIPDRPDVPPTVDDNPGPGVHLTPIITTMVPAVDVAPGPPIPLEASSPSSTTVKAVAPPTTAAATTIRSTTTERGLVPVPPPVQVIPTPTPPTTITPLPSKLPIRNAFAPRGTKAPWWIRVRSPKPTKPTKFSSTSTSTTRTRTSTTKLPAPVAPADQRPLPYNPFPRGVVSPFTVSPPRFELVPAINPEKLDGGTSGTESESRSRSSSGDTGLTGHILITLGAVLIVFGAFTIIGGVVTYYWRRNIGIARARSYDVDGRTLRLNMSEGSNEDVVWSENRDSGL